MTPEILVPEVDVETALLALDQGAVLIDVREPAEWAAGHAPHAVHIPIGEVSERIDEVPLDTPLYLICRSGRRSARVTAYVAERGWDAFNVEGGMLAWETAGGPVVDASGGPGSIA
jgi:rhodanese-related sulfurtransferase